ncbi:MAG: hypothetical protein NTW45_06065 [Rhodocyclales bacterium]|nr:hypothetical protein [Rhodocyclales bacterium]
MSSINIAEIEREAHEMRAKEMQYLLDRLLTAANHGLRSLFSWNPQARRYH